MEMRTVRKRRNEERERSTTDSHCQIEERRKRGKWRRTLMLKKRALQLQRLTHFKFVSDIQMFSVLFLSLFSFVIILLFLSLSSVLVWSGGNGSHIDVTSLSREGTR